MIALCTCVCGLISCHYKVLCFANISYFYMYLLCVYKMLYLKSVCKHIGLCQVATFFCMARCTNGIVTIINKFETKPWVWTYNNRYAYKSQNFTVTRYYTITINIQCSCFCVPGNWSLTPLNINYFYVKGAFKFNLVKYSFKTFQHQFSCPDCAR